MPHDLPHDLAAVRRFAWKVPLLTLYTLILIPFGWAFAWWIIDVAEYIRNLFTLTV